MHRQRSKLHRAAVLGLVGFAVVGSASRVHAQDKPAAVAPPPPVWPDQKRGADSPSSFPQQGSKPPDEPPAGYVRLPPPNVHDGFYLRLHVGLGSTGIEGRNAVGDQIEYSGVSGSLGVALGGTVAPNLVVFGTFIANLAEEPTLSDGQGPPITATGSAGLFGLGAGVVYYVQPLNLYLSGALATLQVSLSDASDNEVYASNFGVGFQGIVGKEWWVSSEWGLGVALEALLAGRMKDKNDSSVIWSGRAVSVLFSATYN